MTSKVGRVDLVLSPTGPGTIESIELTGSAMVGAQLLRARWHPAAIHSSFASSSLGAAKSRLWVMEVRPVAALVRRPGQLLFKPPGTLR